MKNALTLIAVFIFLMALATAGFLFWRSGPTDSYTEPTAQPPGNSVTGLASENNDPYDVLITLTDDGFSPRDVTISAGTRVRFLNESGVEFWPASGIHPTHTLYPEKQPSDCLGSSFDSCDALKPGSFYDYTFYYPGEWPYHDHLRAYWSGKITVVASSTVSTE